MAISAALATGSIPYRLWIGVTGHRDLDDPDALLVLVQQAVERIRQMLPETEHTPVLLGAISPLAEGADRLVAEAVLADPDGILEVPLPLPKHDYMSDFTTEASREEFDALLARAVTITEMPATGSRSEAYARAGAEVIDRCDVLIAVWDGEEARGEGGTAEIVERAKQVVPVLWVPTIPNGTVTTLGPSEINRTALTALDRYNRARIGRDRFEAQLAQQEGDLLVVDDPSIDRLELRAFTAWVTPFLVRADQVALRYQKQFRWLFGLVVVLALIAVAAVAWGAAFDPASGTPAWFEFGLLAAGGVIVVGGRRMHLHDRWISARFLAERLRSACILAVAGVRRGPGDLERGSPGRREELEWVGRAFTEVWRRQPSRAREPELADLKRFLTTAWIDNQRVYHARRSHRFERNHHWLQRIIVVLFLLTLLAALLHGLHAFETTNAKVLLFAAIFLPGLAGAVGAIEIEREYRRNAERYAETARRLADAVQLMSSAPDLETVRALAVDVEQLMDTENRDWFAVMKFHDFEPHV